MRKLLSVVAVVLALTVSSSAQDKDEEIQKALADARGLKAPGVSLPSGAGAWAIRVVRTGGFTGRLQDVTITSQGKVQCLLTVGSCASNLVGNPLQSLGTLVLAGVIPETKSVLSTFCNDCATIRVTMKRREAGGNAKTYFAYWDDVTAGKAPAELVRMAEAALAVPR